MFGFEKWIGVAANTKVAPNITPCKSRRPVHNNHRHPGLLLLAPSCPAPPRSTRARQEKEAKEQQELNELADTDPQEYDRRIKEWHKKKVEGRDGGGLETTDVGDAVDRQLTGDLERRKSLARERRNAR